MKDQLSALIDGELDIQDSAHLITSAKAGGELKSCWANYHLIGDAIRGDAHMSHDFSGRVMAALETEPIVLAPNVGVNNGTELPFKDKKAAYMQSTRFWSVAASVVAVMFVGVMVFQQQFSAPEQLTPVEIAQSVPIEYLAAHQAAAPSSAAYYIQNASFSGQQK